MNNLNKMTREDIENTISDLDHSEILKLRTDLKAAGNPNYLLRPLYYDYKKQCWIKPESIK